MNTQALITIALLHLAAAASPGPSFILVTHAAAYKSTQAGILSALAMGIGALFWAASALFGLGSFFMLNPNLFAVTKILGALFLIWTGFQIFRTANDPVSANDTNGAASISRNSIESFLVALKMQILNPKVVVFFSSIFLPNLPDGGSMLFKIAILSVIFIDETLWYTLLSLIFSNTNLKKKVIAWKPLISKICGLLIAILGGKLLVQ